MSGLSLWRFCRWSSDSAPVHSKTQKACSPQRGKGGGGLGQEWTSWLPLPWLWVVFTISPPKLRCRQLPAHLLLLQLDTATNVLASAELALGSQSLPCDGCHWCRNRAGQWQSLDPRIWYRGESAFRKKKKLKKKVKGRRHELERTTEPLAFMVWPLPILLTLCYESI